MPRRSSAKRAQVRIIGGKWRGRKLRVAGPSIRPSPDRARVTLFNWLAATIPGTRVLDLFAGSGVLGFEALSRGAEHATFVDSSDAAIGHLTRHRAMLDAVDATIVRADAIEWLSNQPLDERWDVVFLDPPFESSLLPATIATAARHLTTSGVVYAESDATFDLDSAARAAGLSVLRQSRAGAVRYGLLGK